MVTPTDESIDSDASAAADPGTPSGWLQNVSARRGGLGAAAVLCAVALFFAWQARKLALGDVALPGPGFFPLVLALSLAAIAAALAVVQLADRHRGETVALGHRDVVIAFAAMLAVPAVFERLGAYLTLGLFSAVLLILIARVSVVRAAIAAVAGMIACWYFFQVLLGLQLPAGPF
jgi:hypothetical protein